MSTYYSVVKYFEGASGESTFTITFPYLRRDHVFVYLSEEPLVAINPETGEPNPPVSTTLLVRGVDYEIQNDTSVHLSTPLAAQRSLTIRRFTELDQRLASYFDASFLTETELNEVTLQLLYLIQELDDFRKIGEGGFVAGDPGDAGGGGPSVEDVVNGVLESPLFDTLTTLIPFVDLNAESVIRNALELHDDWRLNEEREVLQQRWEDARMDFEVQTGANFISVNEAITDETSARATAIEGVTARIGDSISALFSYQDAYASDVEAYATWLNQVTSEFGPDAQAIYLSLANTYASKEEVRASQIEGIETTLYDGSGNLVLASITQLNEAISTETSARATAISNLETTYDLSGTSAFVTEFKEAFSDATSSYGKLTTELNAKLVQSDLEGPTGLIAESSWLSGRLTEVETDAAGLVTAQANRIDSMLTRVTNVDGLDEAGNPITTGTVAIAQETAEAAVSYAEGLVETFRVIGVLQGYNVDNFNEPADWAAAVTEQWNAYGSSIEDAASASAVTTIQAQTAPILYSSGSVIPTSNPDAAGTGYREGYETTGFPNGAIWTRRLFYLGALTTLTYVWERMAVPNYNGVQGVDPGAPYPYIELVTSGAEIHRGRWVSAEVSVVGALIQESATVDITSDSAAALLRNQVQAQVDNTTSAISQDFDLRITPIEGDVEDLGVAIDSQYSVRINNSLGGGDIAIAGFGLGLSTDPSNPNQTSRSDFIVMADYFSIIAPPSRSVLFYQPDPNGSYQFGSSPDAVDAIVPFLVDSANQAVYINGNLFISDTLYGYQGRLREVHLGKAVFGQMFTDANNADARDPSYNDLVDPNGYRFELTSSTDGFWTGPSRDYLMWAGSGTKNDNNAVFWLDSEGNAFFGGTVQAGNISGSLSNVFTTNRNFNPWIPSGGPSGWIGLNETQAWVDAGTSQIFEVNSSRLLTPVVMANFAPVHGKAGEVRIMARVEKTAKFSNNWSAWGELSRATWIMHTNDGQSNTPIQGSWGHGINTRIEIQPQFRNRVGRQHSMAGVHLMVLMLPDSPSAGGGGTDSVGGTTEGGSVETFTPLNPDSSTQFQ